MPFTPEELADQLLALPPDKMKLAIEAMNDPSIDDETFKSIITQHGFISKQKDPLEGRKPYQRDFGLIPEYLRRKDLEAQRNPNAATQEQLDLRAQRAAGKAMREEQTYGRDQSIPEQIGRSVQAGLADVATIPLSAYDKVRGTNYANQVQYGIQSGTSQAAETNKERFGELGGDVVTGLMGVGRAATGIAAVAPLGGGSALGGIVAGALPQAAATNVQNQMEGVSPWNARAHALVGAGAQIGAGALVGKLVGGLEKTILAKIAGASQVVTPEAQAATAQAAQTLAGAFSKAAGEFAKNAPAEVLGNAAENAAGVLADYMLLNKPIPPDLVYQIAKDSIIETAGMGALAAGRQAVGEHAMRQELQAQQGAIQAQGMQEQAITQKAAQFAGMPTDALYTEKVGHEQAAAQAAEAGAEAEAQAHLAAAQLVNNEIGKRRAIAQEQAAIQEQLLEGQAQADVEEQAVRQQREALVGVQEEAQARQEGTAEVEQARREEKKLAEIDKVLEVGKNLTELREDFISKGVAKKLEGEKAKDAGRIVEAFSKFAPAEAAKKPAEIAPIEDPMAAFEAEDRAFRLKEMPADELIQQSVDESTSPEDAQAIEGELSRRRVQGAIASIGKMDAMKVVEAAKKEGYKPDELRAIADSLESKNKKQSLRSLATRLEKATSTVAPATPDVVPTGKQSLRVASNAADRIESDLAKHADFYNRNPELKAKFQQQVADLRAGKANVKISSATDMLRERETGGDGGMVGAVGGLIQKINKNLKGETIKPRSTPTAAPEQPVVKPKTSEPVKTPPKGKASPEAVSGVKAVKVDKAGPRTDPTGTYLFPEARDFKNITTLKAEKPTPETRIEKLERRLSETVRDTLAFVSSELPTPRKVTPTIDVLKDKERISYTDLRYAAAKILDVKVSHGMPDIADADATYREREQTITSTSRNANNPEVLAHEYGHHILNTMLPKMPEEIRSELRSLDYDAERRASGKEDYTEGFAEIMRLALNGEDATLFAPKTMEWIRDNASEETRLRLSKLMELSSNFRAQEAGAAFQAEVQRSTNYIPNSTLFDWLKDRKNWLRDTLLTRTRGIEDFSRAALKASDGKLQAKDNPITVWEATQNKAEAAIERADKEGVKNPLTGKVYTAKTLKSIYKGLGGADQRLFDAFAIASHLIETKNESFPDFDKAATIAEVERLGKTADFNRRLDDLYEITEAISRYELAIGKISKEQYFARQEKFNGRYLSLERVGEEFSVSHPSSKVLDLSPSGEDKIRTKASGIAFKSPVLSINERLIRTHHANMRLHQMETIVKAADTLPGLGKWIQQINEKQAENANKYIVKMGGKMYEVEEKLYRELNAEGSIKVPEVLKTPARFGAWLSLWSTAYNPAFTIGPGLLRDVQSYEMNAFRREGETATQNFLKRWGYAGKAAAALTAYEALPEALSSRILSPETIAKIERYKDSGVSRSTLRKSLQEMVDDVYAEAGRDMKMKELGYKPIQDARAFLRKGFEWYKDILSIPENTFRMADFENTLDAMGFKEGGDAADQLNALYQATVNAQNVTVNFARGSQAIKTVNLFRPFTNAGIQASVRQWQKFQADPASALMYAAAAASFGAMYHFMRKDDDDYKSQPDWVKSGYIVPQGTKAYIPLESGITKTFYNMGRLVATMLDKNNPNLDKDSAETLKMTARDTFILDNAIQGWVFNPIFNLMNNKTPFGGQIVPESKLKLEPELQTARDVPEAINRVGAQLGVSPAQIWFMVNAYGGNLPNTVAKAIQKESVLEKVFPKVFRGEISRQQGDLRQKYDELETKYTSARERARLSIGQRAYEALDAKAKDALYAKFVTPEQQKEYVAVKSLRGLTQDLVSLAEERKGTEEYNSLKKYADGLADFALGRDPLKSYPNPLAAKNVPPEVKQVVDKWLMGVVDRGTEKSADPADKALLEKVARQTGRERLREALKAHAKKAGWKGEATLNRLMKIPK